ncbi:TIGR04086 family membrane protein [Clostridium sp. E02]|uniref:TIGR04086 family membrane protein n=1 Tax=Clostridium sp. E02 TaxID=2487134 RepID=UPI000F538A80|nr:TIGR04086 family membrane protein [Clostridium sp. E02]
MEKSKFQVTLRNLLITYILTGILLVVLALGLYRFRLKEDQIRLGVNVVYILSCLIGGLLMGKSIRQRRFFWGLLLGLLYFVILLAISFLMNRGINGSLNQILTTMAVCAVSGTAGGMLS